MRGHASLSISRSSLSSYSQRLVRHWPKETTLILTEAQNDSLAEFINIAFGRTGAALSELTGHRVMLNPPAVSVHPTGDLNGALAKFVPGDVTSIHQVFVGPIAGDALLLLNHDGAVHLADLLTDGSTPSKYLDESAREVLTEVGNILLNACLGMFGNMLDIHVSFSVPRLHIESLDIKHVAKQDRKSTRLNSSHSQISYAVFC